MRNYETVTSKDAVFLQPYQSRKQILSWVAAVGQGGLRLTGGLPVLQNFYRVFDRYGCQGRKPVQHQSWYVRQLTKSMDRDFGPVSPEARASFWSAYGIAPDEQEALEEYYDNVKLSFAPPTCM